MHLDASYAAHFHVHSVGLEAWAEAVLLQRPVLAGQLPSLLPATIAREQLWLRAVGF